MSKSNEELPLVKMLLSIPPDVLLNFREMNMCGKKKKNKAYDLILLIVVLVI